MNSTDYICKYFSTSCCSTHWGHDASLKFHTFWQPSLGGPIWDVNADSAQPMSRKGEGEESCDPFRFQAAGANIALTDTFLRPNMIPLVRTSSLLCCWAAVIVIALRFLSASPVCLTTLDAVCLNFNASRIHSEHCDPPIFSIVYMINIKLFAQKRVTLKPL